MALCSYLSIVVAFLLSCCVFNPIVRTQGHSSHHLMFWGNERKPEIRGTGCTSGCEEKNSVGSPWLRPAVYFLPCHFLALWMHAHFQTLTLWDSGSALYRESDKPSCRTAGIRVMYGKHGTMPVRYGDIRGWQLLLIILPSHYHTSSWIFLYIYLREVRKYAVF